MPLTDQQEDRRSPILKVVFWIFAPFIWMVLVLTLMLPQNVVNLFEPPAFVQTMTGVVFLAGAVVGSSWLVWKAWRGLCEALSRDRSA